MAVLFLTAEGPDGCVDADGLTVAAHWAPALATGGDVVGTLPDLSLSPSGVSAGSYGDATHVATFDVGADGRLTAAAAVAITGLLSPSGVSPGTYGDATHVAQVTIDANGIVTSAANVAISGGGGGGSPGGAAGDVQYNDGSGGFAGDSRLHWVAGSGLLTIGSSPSVQIDVAGSTGRVLYVQDGTTVSVRLCVPGGGGSFSAIQATDATFTFDAVYATGGYAAQGSWAGFVGRLASTGGAGWFTDGARTVSLCDGANHVLYTAAAGGNWMFSSPPSDVWVALDRIAAALAALGSPP